MEKLGKNGDTRPFYHSVTWYFLSSPLKGRCIITDIAESESLPPNHQPTSATSLWLLCVDASNRGPSSKLRFAPLLLAPAASRALEATENFEDATECIKRLAVHIVVCTHAEKREKQQDHRPTIQNCGSAFTISTAAMHL